MAGTCGAPDRRRAGATAGLVGSHPFWQSIVVDDAFFERAAARRATWTGGAVKRDAEGEADIAFWLASTPSDRWNAVWQMAQDAWVIEGAHGPAPRLQGSPCGVRRREG